VRPRLQDAESRFFVFGQKRREEMLPTHQNILQPWKMIGLVVVHRVYRLHKYLPQLQTNDRRKGAEVSEPARRNTQNDFFFLQREIRLLYRADICEEKDALNHKRERKTHALNRLRVGRGCVRSIRFFLRLCSSHDLK
jgi:hypothetical protein